MLRATLIQTETEDGTDYECPLWGGGAAVSMQASPHRWQRVRSLLADLATGRVPAPAGVWALGGSVMGIDFRVSGLELPYEIRPSCGRTRVSTSSAIASSAVWHISG